jgi:predicted RNase H-like nuclease (RuvC/YqgF family)
MDEKQEGIIKRNIVGIFLSLSILSGAFATLFTWSRSLIDQESRLANKEAEFESYKKQAAVLMSENKHLGEKVSHLENVVSSLNKEIVDKKYLRKLVEKYVETYGEIQLSTNSCDEKTESLRRKALLALSVIEAEANAQNNKDLRNRFISKARGEILEVTICPK